MKIYYFQLTMVCTLPLAGLNGLILYCSLGENIAETAMREVKEETGIDTEFISLLCFRHMHQFRWGNSDFYFTCLLRPLTTDIVIDQSEIADCKWMKVIHHIFIIMFSEIKFLRYE